jgi:hypothetical protein
MRSDDAGERVVDIRPRRAGRSARWALSGVDAGRVHGRQGVLLAGRRPGVLFEGDLDPFADVQPQRPR